MRIWGIFKGTTRNSATPFTIERLYKLLFYAWRSVKIVSKSRIMGYRVLRTHGLEKCGHRGHA